MASCFSLAKQANKRIRSKFAILIDRRVKSLVKMRHRREDATKMS